MKSDLITVFTPTYNRAYRLRNLYESLKAQTYPHFEWLIVDDGSTDDTKCLIDEFISENKILIRYIYKANGGKHTAVNVGTKLAKGELFYIVDSDDKLPANALEIISEYYSQIKDNDDFAGVCGLKANFDGANLKNGFPFEVYDATSIDVDYNLKIKEDKAEVFKTSVLRQYPFPEFLGEKFTTESLVWNRIAQKYKLRYFNTVIYLCEYLEDGLSANGRLIRYKAPRASMLANAEVVRMAIPLKDKIKAYINFWAYASRPYSGYNMLNLYSLLFYIPGKILRYVDFRKLKSKL